MTKIINPTFGTDPEYCAVDSEGNIRSVIGLIPGTKREEHPIGNGCTIQVDNVNCEFTIPPVTTKNEFIGYLDYCIEVGNNYLAEHGLKLATMSSHSYSKDELNNHTARKFGCEPSFDAFTKGFAMVGRPENRNLRSAGFHLHTGFLSDLFTMEDVENFIFCCDLFLGLPSLFIDGDKDRRTLYGSPSNFRYKKKDSLNIIEYRSLGGNLLYNNETIGYCYDRLQDAVEFFNQGDFTELKKDIADIVTAIKNNDRVIARKLITKYNIEVLNFTVDKNKIMENTNKVLVYGSLREGEYNFERFKSYYGNDIKVVETGIVLPGYALHDLGSYPAVLRNLDKNFTVVCDLLEVTDSVKQRLDAMEVGAGYLIESVIYNNEPVTIYEYDTELPVSSIVKSGDWSKYLKEERYAVSK